MTWAKVDDQFHAHRKAKRAWKSHPRALGLHLLAISYCAGHLTDGFVDDEFVEEKVSMKRDRDGATEALVDAGLWHREEDGWRINDWLDYNPSRADVLDKRRRDSARKARGIRAESAPHPAGIRAESDGNPNGVREAPARVVPSRPVPSNPVTTSPPDGDGEEREDVLAVCALLADCIRGNDPKAHPDPRQKGWTTSARLLLDRDGREVTEVERVIRWSQADEFWRSNVLSMPTLRKQYSRLLLRMNTVAANRGSSTMDDYQALKGKLG